MRLAKLEGGLLDYWVALAVGKEKPMMQHGRCYVHLVHGEHVLFTPSVSWGLGGPLIQKYKINVQYHVDLRDPNNLYVCANITTQGCSGYCEGHDRPLTAAMRCLVASKFGDTAFSDVLDEAAE